jgi:hypothetical protein
VKNQNPLRSNLGRIQPKQIDAEKLKREGWNNDGILIIKADDERLSWPEKELIKQIGDKIYNNKTNNKNGEKYGK